MDKSNYENTVFTAMNEHGLSDREIEILRLVATGASNKEIARILYISPNTVKVHLKNIFTKIGAASRTEAAMFAVKNGWVDRAVDGAEAEVFEERERTVAPSRRPLFVIGILGFILLAGAALFLAWWSGRQSQPTLPAAAIATPDESSRWQRRADMPTARYGLASVLVNNQIYAIGGETNEDVTNFVERYDPSIDKWFRGSDKPTPVTDIGAVVLGGKVYVPGGRTRGNQITDVMEIYNPRSDEWEYGKSLPSAISAYSIAMLEGKILVFGGWNGQDYQKTVYVYDPAINSWKEIEPMLSKNGYAGAAGLNGLVYIIGGMDGQTIRNDIEIYDPNQISEASKWKIGSRLNQGRYAMGTVSVAGNIYILGGINVSENYNIQYNPIRNQIVSFDPQNRNVGAYISTIYYDSELFVIGGLIDNEPSKQNLSHKILYTVTFPVVIP